MDVSEIEDEPRYLPTAEDIEAGGTYRTDGEGRQSYGRSFDELADEVRPLPTAEDIENGYVPGSAAKAFRHAAAIRACKMRRRRVE